MKLEKDKVYKINHIGAIGMRTWTSQRTYIICSPIKDIELGEEHTSFKTHFTICFDGSIECDDKSSSGASLKSNLEELNDRDVEEIRNAINMLGENFKYNRKLHKLIINGSNREE